MSYEELHLCPPGGAAEMLEAGVTSGGGRLPVELALLLGVAEAAPPPAGVEESEEL